MQDHPGGPNETAVLVRFLDVAVRMLAEAREEIDALNVYPVPDGDTGTNLYLTVGAARDAVREALGSSDADADADDPDPALVLPALARGALLGARGNSGVILSQMLGAVAHHLAGTLTGADGTDGTDGAVGDGLSGSVLAGALAAATTASYAAVGDPAEGTILTVASAAADAARAAAADGAGVRRTVAATAAAAREALTHTPEQLDVLARAGVVDAGGRGLVVVLDAAERVLTGRRDLPGPAPTGLAAHRLPVAHEREEQAAEGCPPSYAGPAYEVVYLLRTETASAEAEHEVVRALRSRLAGLGDSLVVVGGEGLWKVHVHTDDAGAAVEAALGAGRPEQIRVTHLAVTPAAGPRDPAGRRVVAVAAGPGLERLFADAGARVVPGGPGRRPSTAMLLEAMTAAGDDGATPAEVVVLPNDEDTVAAAELAAGTLRERAEATGAAGAVTVTVIPTRSQVQGLAAMAVHEPARTLAADVLEMTATARHVRQGAVTIAARRAITMAGPCEPGDVLGVIAGDFAVVGRTLAEVAAEVTERLLAGGGDLVTVVVGGPGSVGAVGAEAGADPSRVAAGLAAYLEERHATVDVVVYDGGQERYPLLLSVE